MEIGSCYREPYLQGSFNGVPFETVEASSEHGRRGAEGEFPFGENTAYADLGRKIRRYNISARFAGNDHVQLSEALIAACELPGPGTLVHPTRGIVSAGCISVAVRDNLLEEQGVTYVDMEFVEGGSWSNGLSFGTSILGLALAPLLDASTDSFSASYSPAREFFWMRPGLAATAKGAAQLVASNYRIAIGSQASLSALRAAADLELVASDSELVSQVTVMNDALRLGSGAIAKAQSAQASFDTFRAMANWVAQQPQPGTASGAALLTHMRVISGAFMAQAAASIEFETAQLALSSMDMTVDTLRQEGALAYQACDNNLFLSISKFLDDFTALMYRKAYGFPLLVEYDFAGAVSPLVAAYAIFGDAKRHRVIEVRNRMNALNRAGPVVVGAN